LNGGLHLRAGVRDGQTVLLEAASAYPLQVLRPHPAPDGWGISVLVLMLSGGLLDGDDVRLEVEVEPGARLVLRTQAATQVHRGQSAQRLTAQVGADGWFSYMPHALVPHAGAVHHTQVEVELARTARALVADALSPGRTAYGEAFAYTRVRQDLDVWLGGRLVARERALIEPDDTQRPARLGPATHAASAYLLGPAEPQPGPFSEEASEPGTRADVFGPGGGPGMGGGPWVGVTELAAGGWLVRVLATRAADLDAVLAQVHAAWWCPPPT
jgi:urease accessory protein